MRGHPASPAGVATPGQHFVRVCQEELEALMGPVDPKLKTRRGVTSIMLVRHFGTLYSSGH